MVVLQNSMDFEKCVPGLCIEAYPTSSHNANQAMNIKVEENSDKQVEEEDPVPMEFIGIKVEHEVSRLSTTNQISHTIYAELPGVLPVSIDLPFHTKKLFCGKLILKNTF
jgi:hypothetical protein